MKMRVVVLFFFFQAEDGIRDDLVTGVQTCALPIAVGRGEAVVVNEGDAAAADPPNVCRAVSGHDDDVGDTAGNDRAHLTFDQGHAPNAGETLGQFAGDALETGAAASREDDGLHAPPVDGSNIRIRAAP